MQKKFYFTSLFLLITTLTHFAQTKVSGTIVDKIKQPIPYANIVFKGSKIAVNSDENGHFYMESDQTYNSIEVSFVGYNTKEIQLQSAVTFDLKIVLSEEQVLNEVVVFSGKRSKKNNPAIDILRKIWERRRKNGLKMFDQYSYQKYEKVEFEAEGIDDAECKTGCGVR